MLTYDAMAALTAAKRAMFVPTAAKFQKEHDVRATQDRPAAIAGPDTNGTAMAGT